VRQRDERQSWHVLDQLHVGSVSSAATSTLPSVPSRNARYATSIGRPYSEVAVLITGSGAGNRRVFRASRPVVPACEAVALKVGVGQLIRVQPGVVNRHQVQLDPVGVVPQPHVHRSAAMHRMAIGDHVDLPSGLPDQPVQEHVQSQRTPRGDHRHDVHPQPFPGHPQHRCLPSRRPRPARWGGIRNATRTDQPARSPHPRSSPASRSPGTRCPTTRAPRPVAAHTPAEPATVG
jgi:hypothetical protein